MLKAVLFDMDGLIFNTESVYKQSWQFAALEQGLELSDAFYQQFLGVQDQQCEEMLAAHFGQQLDMQRYKRVRDSDYQTRREQGIAMKPGFEALFAEIKQRGLKTAIVTSSQLSEVKHNFKGSPYLSQFDLLITADQVEHGKPSPDCYLMACHQLDLAPQSCLVLEDSNNGIRSGLSAGCNVIMIPDLLPADDDTAHVTQVASLADVIPYLDK